MTLNLKPIYIRHFSTLMHCSTKIPLIFNLMALHKIMRSFRHRNRCFNKQFDENMYERTRIAIELFSNAASKQEQAKVELCTSSKKESLMMQRIFQQQQQRKSGFSKLQHFNTKKKSAIMNSHFTQLSAVLFRARAPDVFGSFLENWSATARTDGNDQHFD